MAGKINRDLERNQLLQSLKRLEDVPKDSGAFRQVARRLAESFNLCLSLAQGFSRDHASDVFLEVQPLPNNLADMKEAGYLQAIQLVKRQLEKK